MKTSEFDLPPRLPLSTALKRWGQAFKVSRITRLVDNWWWSQDTLSGLVIDLKPVEAQYFAIPKVACSSVMALAVDVLGIKLPPDEWKPEVFQTDRWNHLYARDEVVLTKSKALSVSERRWRFAFVRNPWDRLVSLYAEKIRADGNVENFTNGVSNILAGYGQFSAGMPFDDFARALMRYPDREAEPHWRSQYTFLVDRAGRLPMNFVGRFERLADDMETVRRRLGVAADLPHLLASRHSHYRDYYTPRLRDEVEHRYLRDVRQFGYSF